WRAAERRLLHERELDLFSLLIAPIERSLYPGALQRTVAINPLRLLRFEVRLLHLWGRGRLHGFCSAPVEEAKEQRTRTKNQRPDKHRRDHRVSGSPARPLLRIEALGGWIVGQLSVYVNADQIVLVRVRPVLLKWAFAHLAPSGVESVTMAANIA